jgi:hypothetical protein
LPDRRPCYPLGGTGAALCLKTHFVGPSPVSPRISAERETRPDGGISRLSRGAVNFPCLASCLLAALSATEAPPTASKTQTMLANLQLFGSGCNQIVETKSDCREGGGIPVSSGTLARFGPR